MFNVFCCCVIYFGEKINSKLQISAHNQRYVKHAAYIQRNMEDKHKYI